jgi:LPS O-antigen subunit length determinant protein (WzzB/FepE family)
MMIKAIIAIATICASFYALYNIRQSYQSTPILRQLNATLLSQFNKFKTTFNKKYSSSEEEAYRFQIFSNTFQQIEAVNNAL